MTINMQNSPAGADRIWPGFSGVDASIFRGARVLEIGCGLGGRAFKIAEAGAAKVVGIDILKPSVDKAEAALSSQPDAIKSVVEFRLTELKDVVESDFDIIISENALEHILNVDRLLVEMTDRLKPGGKVLIGFGPLYHSPYGDHGWMRRALPFGQSFPWPWGHLYFRKLALKNLEKQHGRVINDTIDWPYLVLNGLSVDDYMDLFEQCPLSVQSVEINPARSLLAKSLNVLRNLPGMRKYLTWTINVVLVKA